MKVRVLFVDDDEYVLHAYQRMLHNSDFECHVLSEPVMIWQWPGLAATDIVVADQQMPKLSGIELLQQLSQRYPAIKRVLISGDLNSVYPQQSALLLHATLHKPCSKVSLLQCLAQLSNMR